MHQYNPDPSTPFAKAAAATAAPVTPHDDALTDVFATAAAQAVERAARRHQRRRLVAVVSVPAVLLVSGGAAAYAAANIDWSSYWNDATTTEWAEWAQAPDAVVSYTLPSGRTCELRLGEFAFSPADNRPADVPADTQVVSSVVEFARSSLTITDADVQRVIVENRSDADAVIDENGDQEPFGYGTENYDADVEYNLAVPEAVQDAFEAHLAAVGVPSTGLMYQSQQQCSEATP
ncbi:hypothetical protein SK224_06120 [Microbacterium sp. BG28]|uniref:hypothetical protein n=1 Tax=Microbacterium sp. BG28 TaxID=3097356 RepID=UPI002A5ADECE|nr:hypothetical protein [Microbacterium sp. BG28]MDY0828701.1 hypothetical protein [Microbacterium sp. BG28]